MKTGRAGCRHYQVYTSYETDRVVGAKRLGQREEGREEIMYCRNQTGG